jgi:hypothetical protein
VKTFIFVLAVAAATVTTPVAEAQSIATEADVTTGFSTEDNISAVASQLRVFGEVKPRIQFSVEGTWARRSADTTDAFGAAYPYGNRVELSEAYGERTFVRGAAVTSIRAGQYRSPFGIYSRADYGYSGFLRGPLVRYEGYWSVMNTMLERGVDIVVGTPRFSVETSLGVPADNGDLPRRSGLDTVIRAQGYFKDFVVGVSHINSEGYAPAFYGTQGRMDFTGLDARWMRDGVQLRGEWMFGQPWDGPTTKGGYVDASIHPPFLGPVTVVLRTEQLNYISNSPFTWHDTPGFLTWQGRRQTVGGRIHLPGNLTAQLNLIRQSEWLAYPDRTAFDVALTYSIRAHNQKIARPRSDQER